VSEDYPLSVKGVLLLDGRAVLLRNRRGEWELPGGRPDPGEDHSQALAREFVEELSLHVTVGARIDSYVFEVIPGQHVLIVTYGCTLIGPFDARASGEHTDYCLWPVERLSEIELPEGYRRSVERWVRASTIG
jgi:8-oxo-dGTP pyrophosphatase MutT (NUDIX family)